MCFQLGPGARKWRPAGAFGDRRHDEAQRRPRYGLTSRGLAGKFTAMRPFRVLAATLMVLLGVALVPGRSLLAQPPVSKASAAPAAAATVPDSTVRAIEAFAKLQRSINALRDREQAELAEPRNKKVEAQGEIREKYRKRRADSLTAHGYTPAQVSAMTLRISSDDALRVLFETTMERLGK